MSVLIICSSLGLAGAPRVQTRRMGRTAILIGSVGGTIIRRSHESREMICAMFTRFMLVALLVLFLSCFLFRFTLSTLTWVHVRLCAP